MSPGGSDTFTDLFIIILRSIVLVHSQMWSPKRPIQFMLSEIKLCKVQRDLQSFCWTHCGWTLLGQLYDRERGEGAE
jgi:hypothetical protein